MLFALVDYRFVRKLQLESLVENSVTCHLCMLTDADRHADVA